MTLLDSKFIASIFSKVAYFDGELRDLSDICGKDNVKAKDFKPWLVILNREFYSEETVALPIESKSEAIKVMKLQTQELNQFFCFSSCDSGKTHFTKWNFKDLNFTAPVIIPETFLISLFLKKQKKNFASVLSNKNTLYVYDSFKGISSTFKGNLIKNEELFFSSIGVSSSNKNNLENNELFSILFESFKALTPLTLKTFFVGITEQAKSKYLKATFAPVIALGLIYMAFTSGYLQFKQLTLESELTEKKEKVESGLVIQSQFDRFKSEYFEVANALSDHPSHALFWSELHKIFGTAEIQNLRYENGIYIIRGRSKNANAILRFFEENELFENPKFDFPVRNVNSWEQFVISASLVRGKS